MIRNCQFFENKHKIMLCSGAQLYVSSKMKSCVRRLLCGKVNGQFLADRPGGHLFFHSAGWPDWADFRLLGHNLCTLDIFMKIREIPKYLWLLFPLVKDLHKFCRKMCWAKFGRFFHKLIWSLWSQVTAASRAHYLVCKRIFVTLNVCKSGAK
jgi:hypothetical protein